MAATATSSTKLSWADIVKGPTDATTPEMDAVQGKCTLTPAARGERRCFCQGEILVMLGYYGWILPLHDIDHPDLKKTAGRVYVHKRDTPKGVSLGQGDIVSFYLYADDQGLGAESCELLQRSDSKGSRFMDETSEPLVGNTLGYAVHRPTWNANTPEFKPHGNAAEFKPNAYAPEFKPNADTPEFKPNVDAPEFKPNVNAPEFKPNANAPDFKPNASVPEFKPNANAAEFKPVPILGALGGFNVGAAEFVPAASLTPVAPSKASICAFNPAFFSDDESDDESSAISSDGYSGNEGDKECHESDQESTCNESIDSLQIDTNVHWSSDLNAVVIDAPLKSPRASHGEESTSVGSSDSEVDKVVGIFRPPPGLSLPPWRCSPAGLTMPLSTA